MSYQSFVFEQDSGVATIRLNRPETLNSLTFETYEELNQAMQDIDKDDSARAVMITGTGRGFCSGGSFVDIIQKLFDRSTQEKYQFTRLTCDLIKNMRRCRKPIVAAVNGPAVGAGALIALASDVRIVAESAHFAFLFVKVGLAGADMGATYLLPRVVGLGMASELLMTGRRVDADEALRIGLANRVVPDSDLLGEAQQMAATLAAGPFRALGMTKDLINHTFGMDLEPALEMEAQTQALCMEAPEFAEGYKAFLEKRPPVFYRP